MAKKLRVHAFGSDAQPRERLWLISRHHNEETAFCLLVETNTQIVTGQAGRYQMKREKRRVLRFWYGKGADDRGRHEAAIEEVEIERATYHI